MNQLTPTAQGIVKNLIRNRFDLLGTDLLRIEGSNLIAVAREMGFTELANDMHKDLVSELTPNVSSLVQREAA